MKTQAFYEETTQTLSYVVWDPQSKDAVIIDPVLDYDPVGSKITARSVDQLTDFVKRNGLCLRAILETHAHADHLSGARLLARRFPLARIGIGARIVEVQKLFKGFFDLPADFPTDGRQFDLLLTEDRPLEAGTITVETIYTPGHTPACVTYAIGGALYTGDALFMPDQGTGRCDFPGGSAEALYGSIQRLYAYPDDTVVYVGHDYQPGDRPVAWASTIGDEKAHNVQLPATLGEAEFVARRQARDAELAAPRLLFQSVQVNIAAGQLPPPAANERRFLKIPVNVFVPEGPGALSEAPIR